MSNKRVEADSDLSRQITDFSKQIAGSAEITASSLFDYCPAKGERTRSAELVLVIRDFPRRVMSYIKAVDTRTIVIVAVDQWIFERDVERGFLGEASAGTLVFPYTAISGELYLRKEEIVLKKRLILELLANLSFSFPELADRLRIKPEYFMYEVMMNRVRAFPPLASCVANFMRDAQRMKQNDPTLNGYVEALKQLEAEKKVILAEDYVLMPNTLIKSSKNPKNRLTTLSKNAPRTLFTSIFETFPQLLNSFSQNMEVFPRIQTLSKWRKSLNAARYSVDPQKFVFVPTAKGLVSMADRVDIEAFVREKLLNGKNGKIKRENLGGFLNDVFLITANSGGEEKRVLVKRFKDWTGFKWFPLNLWVLGTRTFAVLGKARLERECAIGELLRSEGFKVPKILHVSPNERLVLMEYVEGENLSYAIKRIATSESNSNIGKDLEKLSKVGELLARVHSLNVALGDTKPDNVIVDRTENLYLLDFEQASQGGDKSWDVAEFIYYSGHYLPSLHSSTKAEAIAKAFIDGYLNAGGNVNVVRKAGASKYTRVFSFFTTPSALLTMATICRKTEAKVQRDR